MFGIFVADDIIELYCNPFSKEKGYSFVLLKKITLPTLMTSYTSLEESLEILFSFKVNPALYHNTDIYIYIYINIYEKTGNDKEFAAESFGL